MTMKSRYHKWTDKEKSEIFEMYNSGKSFHFIAHTMNLRYSQTTNMIYNMQKLQSTNKSGVSDETPLGATPESIAEHERRVRKIMPSKPYSVGGENGIVKFEGVYSIFQ